jgi:NADH-quinone oxidoreductase subunit C
MTFEEIKEILVLRFGNQFFIEIESQNLQPAIELKTNEIAEFCIFLKQHSQLYFDFLSCLTGIDNGLAANTMEVIYHLYSIPFGHSLVLKVKMPRSNPEVPTVSHIWRTANWHEREAYDLLGIRFTNHPDLRRILMPSDWKGHPLQKDYQNQTYYHDLKTDL